MKKMALGVTGGKRLSAYGWLAVFMFVFFTTQTTNQYIQLYLYEVGFSKTQIGLITGTAGLIALFCQPILGGMADGAASKKRMMAVVLTIATVAFPAMYLRKDMLWIFLLYTVFHVFFSFSVTLNNAMSVEYCQLHGRPYGPMRMLGALSYSLMMFVISAAVDKTVDAIFLLFPAACVVSLLVLPQTPDVKGSNNRNSGLEHISPTVLLKDKTVVTLIVFQTLMGIATGISNGYFSIYFTDDMGGTARQFALCVAVAAMCEVPFLFLTDRWLDRLGPRKMLLMLCGFTALRHFLCFGANSVLVLFLARCMNFFNVIESVAYSLILIRIVKPQLKTSAQTLSSTVQNVANLMVSSYLGGFLADLVGIRPLFAVSGVLTVVLSLIFTFWVFPRTLQKDML